MLNRRKEVSRQPSDLLHPDSMCPEGSHQVDQVIRPSGAIIIIISRLEQGVSGPAFPLLSWSLHTDADVGPMCGVELSTCIIPAPKSVCPLPYQYFVRWLSPCKVFALPKT